MLLCHVLYCMQEQLEQRCCGRFCSKSTDTSMLPEVNGMAARLWALGMGVPTATRAIMVGGEEVGTST